MSEYIVIRCTEDGVIKRGELSPIFACGVGGRSIFGPPSNFMTNMVLEAAKNGKTVIYFSYEGPPLDTLAPTS